MRRSGCISGLLLTFTLHLCVVGSAIAGPAGSGPGGPMATTRAILERSNQIVTGPGSRDEKLETLKELLRDFLDTDALGRQSMGPHLEGRTPEQERRFLELFRSLFVRTYVQRLLLFEVPDFAYGKESIDGDRAAIDTEIVTDRDRFSVDYTLQRSAGKWRATDIMIEETSLASNFRAQFDAALGRDSFDALLEKLERKMASQRKAEAGAKP